MLADQCITVDDEGWFRWWTLANVLSVESTDAELSSSRRCLQVFRMGSDLSRYPWKAHSLAALNNGQSLLVAGAHKVKLLRRVRIKPRVLAASAVLFNEASLTIATATDREIRVWDAASGSLLRSYRGLVGADITCVDLDSRQRKLVVGAQNGELAVVNYLNGAVLGRWTPHGQQVSALLYCKEDHTVLTASWDRSLRLYDDDAPKTGGVAAQNVLLRCITEAHDSDIKCLAYCHALSLVASGGTDGVIKIWDYIYFLLEDTCTPPLNVLEFIEPYPLLLSGHESGQVCVWSLAPSKPTVLLLCFYPFHMTPVKPVEQAPASSSPLTTAKLNSPVTCCRTFYDETGGEQLAAGIDRGRFLLFASSFNGEVIACDISKLILAAHVRAFCEQNMPSRYDRAYNPRRRFLRQGKHAKRLRNRHTDSNATGNPEAKPLHVDETDVVCTHRWTAHRGNVRSLQIVAEPRGVITCGSDKGVYVWDFQGRRMGSLGTGMPPVGKNTVDKTTTDIDPNIWRWEVDVTSAAALKRKQAQQIWDELKGTKLKSLALKQQSMTLLDRERKRNEQQPQESGTLNHSRRLFDQLAGKTTWKKSDLQLARQAAWEKERVKFQQRMKTIMRRKDAKRKKEEQRITEDNQHEGTVSGHGDVSDSLGKLEVLGAVDADDPHMLLPTLQNPVQELPFADKDNWAVGSLNREKQMYEHFHRENIRRSNKQIAGSSGLLRQKRLECSIATMDLTPSAFLLEKLGVSCIIHENVDQGPPPRRKKTIKKLCPKRVTALARARSLASLPDRPNEIFNKSAPTLVSSVSTSVLKRRSLLSTLYKQYDELLDDDHMKPSLHPIRRHPKSALTTADRGPQLRQNTPSSSSAGAIRSSAKPQSPKKELKSAKKVRIRSDAALMRQERFGQYSRDDIVNIYRTFSKLDQDGSGAITIREIVGGSGLFSGTHMQDNIGSIFSSIDKDQSGLIDLAELCTVVFGDAPPEVLEEILRLCRLLEFVEKNRRLYDTDNNGDIDASELLEALRYNDRFYESDRRGSTQLTKEDVARIILSFDANANATLDLQEFIELFREDA
ncbi:uncharacterized protein PITG_06268 [Phytophthora infestans T30-4]|uniref:EF-hand domain-containing protein n=1 Tax=Phytophthora infestans (strain T30-4) TaxID=403677 RepID=D0N4H0_PHYIT|nr:uncharacterized protein PITG_06268 [Phytophthora infestans T30-4]EEY69778.1 conserved hypothetical protein [Phytophthora infestans T30-4]|eukprot:XP_002998425.1 conserved hypothetical protein [Phytophthora infestans T30-4]